MSKKHQNKSPPATWQWLFRQACTKNAHIYNNVCTLLTHNLSMHFELACKVHICVLENRHIPCNARLHHQLPWVSTVFSAPNLVHMHGTVEVGLSPARVRGWTHGLLFSKQFRQYIQKSWNMAYFCDIQKCSKSPCRGRFAPNPQCVTVCFWCCTSRVPTTQTLKKVPGDMRTSKCASHDCGVNSSWMVAVLWKNTLKFIIQGCARSWSTIRLMASTRPGCVADHETGSTTGFVQNFRSLVL